MEDDAMDGQKSAEGIIIPKVFGTKARTYKAKRRPKPQTTKETPTGWLRCRRTTRGRQAEPVGAGIVSVKRRWRQKGNISSGMMVAMEEVVRPENMKKALNRVISNKGAAGTDGMTVEELTPYLKEHWPGVREKLLQGTYTPSAVLRVEIPKPDGGKRLLGIPTVLDRLLQQAILQVLTPLFDPHFSDNSYGFRPGRSCHQAVKAARGHVEAGYRYVVDIDLEKFFDRVNHDVLMARVARRVKDKRILRILRRYLTSGVMMGGVVEARREGTPQGGPLSPLLSNIMLDDLDKELERRGHRFCRYADDCNIYVRSKAAGARVKQSITSYLWKRLRLKVNEGKSAVERPWKREFLGYSMTPERKPKLKVSPSAEKRAKEHLREILRKGRGRKLSVVIGEIALFLRGWIGYFRLSQVKRVFEELDGWIRRKKGSVLWKQWKKPKTRAKKMIQFGIDKVRAYESACNGHGSWWNAGASHMNAAITTKWLSSHGLLSLITEHRRLNALI
ncbi:MAG: group II intron reverse transcriptase/maturase [Nitrospirae bacterium]|nr:group II intron reverse transcriptase/maturase [Nitrospirota bacterium]